MRGLGEEAEAVGPDRRAELEADQHAGRDHRDERRPPLWAHAPSIGPTRRAGFSRALPTTPLGEGEVSLSRWRCLRGSARGGASLLRGPCRTNGAYEDPAWARCTR